MKTKLPPINRFKLYKAAPEIYEDCKTLLKALITIKEVLEKSDYKPNTTQIEFIETVIDGNYKTILALIKSIEGKEVVE